MVIVTGKTKLSIVVVVDSMFEAERDRLQTSVGLIVVEYQFELSCVGVQVVCVFYIAGSRLSR